MLCFVQCLSVHSERFCACLQFQLHVAGRYTDTSNSEQPVEANTAYIYTTLNPTTYAVLLEYDVLECCFVSLFEPTNDLADHVLR